VSGKQIDPFAKRSTPAPRSTTNDFGGRGGGADDDDDDDDDGFASAFVRADTRGKITKEQITSAGGIVHQTPTDGNCQFSAVSMALSTLWPHAAELDAATLRELAVNRALIANNFYEAPDAQPLEELRQPGQWEMAVPWRRSRRTFRSPST
jgi:hypothetical protein